MLSDKELKTAVVEYLWLTYYNDTLLQQQIISEQNHSAMRRKFYSKYREALHIAEQRRLTRARETHGAGK